MRYYYDGNADEPGDEAEPRGVDASDDDDAGTADDTAADGHDELDEDDDPELDADFPRGDGTADTSAVAYCPYCGELNELAVDPGGGSLQSYVEDCHVCCRPWRVTVGFDHEGHATAQLDSTDD